MLGFIFLLGHNILGTEFMTGLCRTDCKKFYNLLTEKYQCEKCTTNYRRNKELLERNIWKNGSTQSRSLLDQKPVLTKFQYGMELNI